MKEKRGKEGVCFTRSWFSIKRNFHKKKKEFLARLCNFKTEIHQSFNKDIYQILH